MKKPWPLKLPSDPIEAARTILSNPVPGKGLDFILERLNVNSKPEIFPKLFEGAKVLSLETKSIRFIEKKYGIRLVPIVLVLPCKYFRAVVKRIGKPYCTGIYFEASDRDPFPFNETGFCLVEEKGNKKDTMLTAWHEIRHHIYDVRSFGAVEVNRAVLTQLFAYVANVKAGQLPWSGLKEILAREVKDIYKRYSFGVPRGYIDFFEHIDRILVDLKQLERYFPQELIDNIILRSRNLGELRLRLDRLMSRIAKSPNEYSLALTYSKDLVDDFYVSEQEAKAQLKRLKPAQFVEWSKETMRRLDLDALKLTREQILQLLKKANLAPLIRLDSALSHHYKDEIAGHMILMELFTDLLNYLSKAELGRILAAIEKVHLQPDHLGSWADMKLKGEDGRLRLIREDTLKQMKEKGWKPIE